MDIQMTPSNVEAKQPLFNGGAGSQSVERVEVEAAPVQATPAPSSVPAAPVELTTENELMIESINSQLAKLSVGVAFSIDETAGASVVKLIDRSTSEVVKQYPNDEALKVMRNIQSFLENTSAKQGSNDPSLTGALFNEII